MRGEVERGYRNGEERDRKGREDVGKRTRNGGWRERRGKRKGEERGIHTSLDGLPAKGGVFVYVSKQL